jgi:hypothetical protein
MSGLPPRPSLFTGLLALGLAALGGCASSGADALYTRAPFPDYASAEPVQGLERSTLCHQGRTITIVNLAVESHLQHGDYFGECSEESRARHEAHYRTHAATAAGSRP